MSETPKSSTLIPEGEPGWIDLSEPAVPGEPPVPASPPNKSDILPSAELPVQRLSTGVLARAGFHTLPADRLSQKRAQREARIQEVQKGFARTHQLPPDLRVTTEMPIQKSENQ